MTARIREVLRHDLTVRGDGSLLDDDGRVLCFSEAGFQALIADSSLCFVCGRSSGTKRPVTGEHIIPNWLLRKHTLHSSGIATPGGRASRYGSYKVPCCNACNASLGDLLEHPVSASLNAGYEAVVTHIANEGPQRLFAWMCLLHFKTHYRDRSTPVSLDPRCASGMVADQYEWSAMHHIHAVARATWMGASLSTAALGSLLVLRAEPPNDFDYHDLHAERALFIRTGDVAILAVLDDAGGVKSALQDFIAELGDRALAPIQMLEVLARVAYASRSIVARPEFGAYTDDGLLHIVPTSLPEFRIEAFDAELYGALLWSLVAPSWGESLCAEQVESDIRAGKYSFFNRSTSKGSP